jgi:hypothetical protein
MQREREEEGRDTERRGGGAAIFVFRECREKSLSLRFRVRKSILFIVFLSAGLVEPVRFGLVQSVLDFENRNRIESEFFL